MNLTSRIMYSLSSTHLTNEHDFSFMFNLLGS